MGVRPIPFSPTILPSSLFPLHSSLFFLHSSLFTVSVASTCPTRSQIVNFEF